MLPVAEMKWAIFSSRGAADDGAGHAGQEAEQLGDGWASTIVPGTILI